MLVCCFANYHNCNTSGLLHAGLCYTMFTVSSTVIWAVLTGPADWVCHIGTLTPCIEAVAQSCIIITWWSGPGGIQALSARPTGFLQCFDTVGLVIWSVKIIPDMTYNVFGGTLNLAESISQCSLLKLCISEQHILEWSINWCIMKKKFHYKEMMCFCSWQRCLKLTLMAWWDHLATAVVASTSSHRKFSAATANSSVLFRVIQFTTTIKIGLSATLYFSNVIVCRELAGVLLSVL